MNPIPRSYLFVPATRPDRFEKALHSGAHAVIADLEDAVPAPEKNSARQSLAQSLNPATPIIVRINAASTEWFRDDIALCDRPGISAVILPKTESADQVRELANHVVLPLIESANGIANAAEIARCENVERLIFGHLDLQLDLNITDEELVYFRSALVLASRLAELPPPVDGITTSVDSPDLIRDETHRAIRLGFGAKLCIHPRQVPIVNQCFRPTPLEVDWAREVIDAAARSRGGPVLLNGTMVDRPVITRAERILAEASR